MFNDIPVSKILKFFVYILLIYFVLVFLMSKIKVIINNWLYILYYINNIIFLI